MLSNWLRSYLRRDSLGGFRPMESLEPRQLLTADLTGAFQQLPDIVGAGSPIEVAFNLTNVGDTKGKGSADIAIYLSADDTLDEGDVLFATTKGKATLDAGQTDIGKPIKKLTVPGNTAPGAYRLIAVIDADEKLEDSNRANNVVVGPLMNIIPPDYNLVAGLDAIKLDTALLAGASGNKTKVPVLVSVVGDTPLDKAQLADIRVVMRPVGAVDDSQDVQIGAATDQKIGSLKPGKAKKYNISAELPANLPIGDYRIVAIVDSGNDLQETDETDNTAATTAVYNVAQPNIDLTATFTKVDLGTDLLAGSGDKGSVEIEVANLGNVPTDKSQLIDIAFVARPVGAVDSSQDVTLAVLDDTKGGNITPGKPAKYKASFEVPANLPEGSYNIVAIVDAGNDLVETNEDNNTDVSDSTHTVTQPNIDLVATLGPIGLPANLVAGAGDSAKVDIIVANAGNVALNKSQTVDIQIVARPDGAVDDSQDVVVTTIADAKIGGVEAGKPKTVKADIEIPASLANGNYRLVAIVDSSDEVIETNEANNSVASPTVYNIAAAFVDVVANVADQGFEANTTAGDTARGTVSFTNNGNVALDGPVTIQYYVTRTGSQPVLIGQLTQVVKLAVAASINIRVDLTLPPTLLDGATYTFEVRIVPGGTIAGDDPTNNQTVPPGETTVTVPEIALPQVGGSVKFLTAQSGQGDGIAGVVNKTGRFQDGLGRQGDYSYVGGGPISLVVMALEYDDQTLIPPFWGFNLTFSGNPQGNIGGKTMEFFTGGTGAQGVAQIIGATANFRIK
jgi:uncharacterized membrane protein